MSRKYYRHSRKSSGILGSVFFLAIVFVYWLFTKPDLLKTILIVLVCLCIALIIIFVIYKKNKIKTKDHKEVPATKTNSSMKKNLINIKVRN